jgi:glycogen debranching enzyme
VRRPLHRLSAAHPSGLENRCWKDSGDSIAFADRTLAEPPLATCELLPTTPSRTARLAREVWHDPAADLKRRFNEDYWLPERKFFAFGLDQRSRRIPLRGPAAS